jgi:hypothetical protein
MVGNGGIVHCDFRVLWVEGPFWSMPSMFITGTAAAASIAWIISIGNLGGFFGPSYVGLIKVWTDSYAGGLYGLAFLCVPSAVVCAVPWYPEPCGPREHCSGIAGCRLKVGAPIPSFAPHTEFATGF